MATNGYPKSRGQNSCVYYIYKPEYEHIPPLRMIARRFALSAVAATMIFGQAGTAFAATSAEIVDSLNEYINSEFCDDQEGRSRGSCISDVIKRMKNVRKDFADAIKEEREEWQRANNQDGLTPEYRLALRDYLQEVAQLRREFAKKEREILRIFFDKQKEARLEEREESSSSSTRPTFTRRITRNSFSDAEEQCSDRENDMARRICLRQALRLINPNTRIRGARVPQITEEE